MGLKAFLKQSGRLSWGSIGTKFGAAELPPITMRYVLLVGRGGDGLQEFTETCKRYA